VPSIYCHNCGNHFRFPVVGPVGGCCPSCGETAETTLGGGGLLSCAYEYANVALVGAAMGLVGTWMLFLSRF
jgi:hypothetical protein